MTQIDKPAYLILGATGGIGSALCRRLAGDGAHLMLGARTEETLGALAAEVGGNAYTLDATDFEQVHRLVTHAVQAYGRLDGTRSGWVTGQVIGVDGGLGTVRPR